MHGQTARGPATRQPETRRRARTTIILTAVVRGRRHRRLDRGQPRPLVDRRADRDRLVVGPLIGLLMAGAAEDGRHDQVPERLYEHPGIADRGPSDPASPQYDPAVDPNVPDDRR